jgi:hypothetical protein
MSKTAEEIAKHWGFSASTDDAIEAMREFAAQEVDAYKMRLKVAIDDSTDSHILNKGQIEMVINAVK